MRNIVKQAAAALTLGTMVAVLAMPANAASLGVGASIGGSGGVNAGAGASVGGGSGVNAGLGASVGGTNGVNAGAGASVGGSGGIDAGATASIGGSQGINAGVGANVGNGVNANIDASVGNSANVGVGVGLGAAPSATGTPGALGPEPSAAVAQMSGTQLARMKKRCADVLSSQNTYDSDLRALCLMIARR